MTGREVVEITTAREKCLKQLFISVDATQIGPDYIQKLTQVLNEFKAGTVPVKLRYNRMEGAVTLALGTDWWVTPTDALLHQLKQLATIHLEFN